MISTSFLPSQRPRELHCTNQNETETKLLAFNNSSYNSDTSLLSEFGLRYQLHRSCSTEKECACLIFLAEEKEEITPEKGRKVLAARAREDGVVVGTINSSGNILIIH